MNHHRSLVLLLVLLATVLFPACGLIIVPFELSAAAANTKPVHIRGTVVDDQGAPLSGVIVIVGTQTEEWQPFDDELRGLQLFWTTSVYTQNHQSTRLVNGEFQFDDRSNYEVMKLDFSNLGYYPRSFILRDGKVVQRQSDGRETLLGDSRAPLRIQLHKRGNPTTLTKLHTDIWLMGDGSRVALRAAPAAPERLTAISAAQPIPAGFLYVDADRDEKGILISSLENTQLPRDLKLGLPGDANGIQLYTPQQPEEVEWEMRQAPDQGYANQITLNDYALTRIAHHEKLWFYLKSADNFGRGCLETSCTCTSDDRYVRFEAQITLFMQPDHSRNLENGK